MFGNENGLVIRFTIRVGKLFGTFTVMQLQGYSNLCHAVMRGAPIGFTQGMEVHGVLTGAKNH